MKLTISLIGYNNIEIRNSLNYNGSSIVVPIRIGATFTISASRCGASSLSINRAILYY